MVQLPTEAIINDTNIDTIERAIVFSATLLKAHYTKATIANNQSVKIDKTIQITHKEDSENNTKIIIEANLPFNNIQALQNGGEIIDSLIILDRDEILETSYICTSSPDYDQNLPSSLPNLTSLEQYFYYNCSLLKSLESKETKNIEIKFLADTNTGGIASIKIILPFDYNSWLQGSNYVCTVQNIFLEETDDDSFGSIPIN